MLTFDPDTMLPVNGRRSALLSPLSLSLSLPPPPSPSLSFSLSRSLSLSFSFSLFLSLSLSLSLSKKISLSPLRVVLQTAMPIETGVSVLCEPSFYLWVWVWVSVWMCAF